MVPEFLFVVTAYATGCDTLPSSRTKAGTTPVVGFTVAADPRVLPIGSIVAIEGLPGQRQVHDVGGAVRGRHVDLFLASCAEARAWGRQRRRVLVLHTPQRGAAPESARSSSGDPDARARDGAQRPAARAPSE